MKLPQRHWHKGERFFKPSYNSLLNQGVWELLLFLSQLCSAVRQRQEMLCPQVCSYFQSQSHDCLVSCRDCLALCSYPMNMPHQAQAGKPPGKGQIQPQ